MSLPVCKSLIFGSGCSLSPTKLNFDEIEMWCELLIVQLKLQAGASVASVTTRRNAWPTCVPLGPLVFPSFPDQPRNCRLLPYPVQLGHAGESAARCPRPQPAACRPAGPAERPLLSGATPTTHTSAFFLHQQPEKSLTLHYTTASSSNPFLNNVLLVYKYFKQRWLLQGEEGTCLGNLCLTSSVFSCKVFSNL